MKNVLFGCSHVLNLIKSDKKWGDPWDWEKMFGISSLAIYDEESVTKSLEYSGKFQNIFVFPLRSIAYNTITKWMEPKIKARDYTPMDEPIRVMAVDNETHCYLEIELY